MASSTQTNMASEASQAYGVARLAEASAIPPQRACPKGYTAVERSLWRQMTESTGAHVCDSGGAYGRHWERNRRAHDLKARPFATIGLEMGPDSPDVSVSTFHRLSKHLASAPGMNRRLAQFNRQYDPRNVRSWLLRVRDSNSAYLSPQVSFCPLGGSYLQGATRGVGIAYQGRQLLRGQCHHRHVHQGVPARRRALGRPSRDGP